jgi:PadR family transcriptional regulator, regulatory protein PadR
MESERERAALLQGTLDVLILRTLLGGEHHGHAIVRAIQQRSGDVILVDHGSLYPALQRLEARGWVEARWGQSETGRRARFYALSDAGRAALVKETSRWETLSAAIGRVLAPSTN